MGRCVSYVTKCYVCNMKRETITYVPASQPGPHYVEAGMRPDSLACIAQYNGSVMAAQYYSTTDNFRDVTGVIITPVCWWHLPAAVANTEREWFESRITRIGYAIDRWEVDGEYRYRVLSDPNPEFKLYETNEQAIDAAYNHWVAAGRP